ncbi:AI-2E family transporter [Candidatus Liberibacter africanus]|uniref:AI-2E family transporter n=1 Tax=Liberibacter africanus TaxID=34020 RepID=UPI00339D6F66
MRETILNPQGITRWMIIFIILAALYFIKGFFAPVLAALIIGFTTWPLYNIFIPKEEKSSTLLAAFATILVAFSFIIPLLALSYYGMLEIKVLASQIALTSENDIPVPSWLSNIPNSGWSVKLWKDNLSNPQCLKVLVKNFLEANITNYIKQFVSFFSVILLDYCLSAVFMLIALFFFYRDGLPISRQLDSLGEHLFSSYWKKFSRIIPKVIRSTFLGMTIIALGEGLILGTAYWMAGVPSHNALGIITALMAMIPGGAPIAFTVVSIYLLIKGNIINAILLFSWGAIELFIVDKTLRPFLVGGPIKLPFLPTFFGLVGGVKTMGLLGLFIGPVLMALVSVMWKESIIAIKEKNMKKTK